MKTRDFASRYIHFGKSSDVTGPFDLARYRFLGAPMDAADDIEVKRLVILKASSCLGTVLGQIINAKRIACDVGDQMMVCQTEEDASKWTKTRGKEWLESIADCERLVKDDKYAKTNDLWLFRHKFLSISGPGINAAQSVQVRFIQTDESHLDAYPPGRLAEFEKRMGNRWDRQSTHITTAPDAGKEVAEFWEQTQQAEWHWCCPKCHRLIWPLWSESAKEEYNGETIFHWREYQSEAATLESIMAICPHCQATCRDTSRERYALQEGANYVAKHPTAAKEFAGFRWSSWAAAHWMAWRGFLAEHLAAMRAAKMGDLKPHEDFVKKRECRIYVPHLPDFGEGSGDMNYKLGDAWKPDDYADILTADYQAGSRGEGSHLWALVTRWDRLGNSRRLAYRKLLTWVHLSAMQDEFEVHPRNVYVDCGYDDRTVFRQCGLHKWYAIRGSDAQQFHEIKFEGSLRRVPMPYSQPERQNGNAGAQPDKLRANLKLKGLPDGWCLGLVMHNPELYGILNALVTGASGRYYGIASDMPKEYTEGFPAFIPVIEKDRKTNVEKIIWRLVKPFAHPWDCEIMALVGAMRAGYFPLAKQQAENSTCNTIAIV